MWVYNRAIDIDGVRRFHQHLQQGRLSRRIERSPLPFGRHRWVSPSHQSELEIAAPRPRAEFDTWLDEQANAPLDAEHGPGWHLAVLPFSDGGAGLSLIISHCLTDGVGLCEALAAAAAGHHDPISWPAAGSRRRWQALSEDARQTARDISAIGHAVVAAAQFARRHRSGDDAATAPSVVPAREDEPITLPTATVFVDADEWDARAQSPRGDQQHAARGTGGPAGAASGSGHRRRLGRRDSARQRAHRGDTRANAITNVDITVDPEPATTDLREIRAAIKQGLIRSQDAQNERFELLPLVPLLPQGLVRRCGRGFRRRRGQRRLIQSRCGHPSRLPAGRHRGRPIRHEATRPGGDQGDHAPAGRIAGGAVGKDARTVSLCRYLRISRASPTRMTVCDTIFRAR